MFFFPTFGEQSSSEHVSRDDFLPKEALETLNFCAVLSKASYGKYAKCLMLVV